MIPVAAAASASSGATSASPCGVAEEFCPASTASTISPANQNSAATPSHRYPLATGPLNRLAPAHRATTAPAAASMPRTLTVGPP